VASTIHSLVYGLLGISRTQVISRAMLVDFGKEIGVTISGDFDITGEQERYIEEGDEAMSIIGRADARMVPHMEEYKCSELTVPERSFRYISESYKAWKKEFGYIDFNDMLTSYLQSPIPLRYDVLIVDEAQDLSQLQWAVVDELVKTVQWCVVAGDMDQALFVWGGAMPSGMNAFGERHGSDSHDLTQSYRIPSKVHTLAMSVRSRIKEKNDVTYKPRPVEGSYGFHASPDSIVFNSSDTMILYRTHSLRRELEGVLIDRLIPFTCMNGMPGPWSGKWGRAVTAYRIYSKGEHELTKRQATVLEQMSWYRTIPTNKHWSQVLNIPDRFKNYMVQTEGKLPTVRLSTIHGAKGKEADRVIMYTGMTQRTVDGMTRDPDAEHRVFYVGVTRAKERLDIVQGDLNYDIY